MLRGRDTPFPLRIVGLKNLVFAFLIRICLSLFVISLQLAQRLIRGRQDNIGLASLVDNVLHIQLRITPVLFG